MEVGFKETNEIKTLTSQNEGGKWPQDTKKNLLSIIVGGDVVRSTALGRGGPCGGPSGATAPPPSGPWGSAVGKTAAE